ncbi:UvrB/UvrC motif-containing protein [Candidatus Berkelbacteria bacterium]|nr:UvrB/UvrC motif-containing protein [Candidatus Berkelbacteria bacterium]
MKRTYKTTQLEQLPRNPGVYYYHDREENILYIGKATSLRARIRSYWQRPLDRRLSQMLPQIASIKIQTTDTALEALILEANQIGKHRPKFNVRGKDNKTFAQIALTSELYPRLLISRPTQKLSAPINRTFGPYVSSQSAQKALKTLRSIFKFECRGKVNSGRPCLYYHLKLCPGICVGQITPRAHRKIIRRVVQFLEGKKTRLINTLQRAMIYASKTRRYEDAARLRDELFALTHIRDTAFMTDDATSLLETSLPARLEAYDISNLGREHGVGSLIVLEHGRPNPSEYRRFQIKHVREQNDLAMLRELLMRRFKHFDWTLPDLILVDGGQSQLKIAESVVRKFGLNIPVASIIKGPSRKLARLVFSEQARALLNRERLTTQLFEPITRLARDEAHRFAIQYHRKLRARSILPLDGSKCPGE